MDVLLPGGVHHLLHRHVPAQVQHLIAVVLQHHPDDILANVVDVPFHSGQQNLALGDALATPAGNALFDQVKAGTGGVGGVDELRQEDNLLFVLLPHHIQGGNQLG